MSAEVSIEIRCDHPDCGALFVSRQTGMTLEGARLHLARQGWYWEPLRLLDWCRLHVPEYAR